MVRTNHKRAQQSDPGVDDMSNILKFPSVKAKTPPKFGLKRVRRRKRENPDQLDLFVQRNATVLKLPAPALSPFEEALIHDEGGDAEKARELYTRAISEGDCTADAFCNLGVLESKEGHASAAFGCFKEALKRDQQHWETHYNLGNFYFDAQEYRPARVHFELAAELEPSFRNIYFNLGLTLTIAEDYQAAIDALSTYRELAPEAEGSHADDLLASLEASLAAQTPY